MATHNKTKLKILFEELGSGKIVMASYLESVGISKNLRKYYVESGWIEPVGRGAYKKPGDSIEWSGGLHALQKQAGVKVHVGGLTSLSLQGFGHYIRNENEPLYLFSAEKAGLPKWFSDYFNRVDIMHIQSTFLNPAIAVQEIEIKQNLIFVSLPERAIMECLYLCPARFDLAECYQIFESLVNLRPKTLNRLLHVCKSVKVKRLFLYMAEKANHSWVKFLDKGKINLGSGTRMIVKNGVFNSKYLITLPKGL